MMDRETVIKGIQECDLNGGLIGNCPYKGVLSLLKEQEHKDRMYHALEDDWKRLKGMLKEQEAEKSKISNAYLELVGKASKQPEIVRCKDCKHRPIKPNDYKSGFDLEFPDYKCPCQCVDDGWYSWYPADNWFCADGEGEDAEM